MVVGIFVGLLLVRNAFVEDGSCVVGSVSVVVSKLPIMIRNQFMFQPPTMALMPNAMGPAFRVTVCETVCHF